MIGLPYPKYMNSNNDVDMAAAAASCARSSGPGRWACREDRWVFPHAGADCHDTTYVSNRADLALDAGRARSAGSGRSTSPASASTTSTSSTCTRASRRPCRCGRGRARARPRPPADPHRRPVASPAGPWNNYVMHAIATVVARPPRAARRLRARVGQRRLRHQARLRRLRHDAARRRASARRRAARPRSTPSPAARWPSAADAAGPATVEAYTVMHDRDGEPETAFAACLARRRPPRVGHDGEPRRRGRAVRGRVGRPAACALGRTPRCGCEARRAARSVGSERARVVKNSAGSRAGSSTSN